MYFQIKSSVILAVLRRIVTSLRGHLCIMRPGNTTPYEEMLQRWRAVGSTMSDFTVPKFESKNSRSRDERVTARPTAFIITVIGEICLVVDVFNLNFRQRKLIRKPLYII